MVKEALQNWIASNLGVSTFDAWSENSDEMCPGIVMLFDGMENSDVMNSLEQIECYKLILLAATTGASDYEKEQSVAVIEQGLRKSLLTSARINPAWSHITGKKIQGDYGSGYSQWNIKIWTTGG